MTRQIVTVTLGLLAMMSVRPVAAQFRFDFFDAPDATITFARGINNAGEIVGTYTDTNFETAGFHIHNGAVTTVRLPNTFSLELNGINDSGATVGTFVDSNFTSHGFVFNGVSVNEIEIPDAFNITPSSINNQGIVVGTFTEFGTSSSRGFISNGSNITPFDAPGSNTSILGGGINDAGIVAGTYFDNGFHGYTFDGTTFTTLDLPNVSDTFISDINNRGDIVGFFEPGVGSSRTGFVLRNGQLTPLDIPGAQFTNLEGINEFGVIVGYYADANDIIHGFTATPVPEPTMGLLLTAAILSGGIAFRGAKMRRL